MDAGKIKFNAYGHENVLGEHRTTIEFNHDDYLTPQGDCIVGIRSDFNLSDFTALKSVLKKIRVSISCNKMADTVICYYNPLFNHATHLIIRKSDYLDERTFAIRANKASCDLCRKLIGEMKKPGAEIKVTVEPVKIKAVVFDFDNTLEEWSESSARVLGNIARWLNDEFFIDPDRFIQVFRESAEFFCRITNESFRYSRKHWFKRTFDAMAIYADPGIYEKLYWEEVQNAVSLLPGAEETLKAIKQKKGLVSDSDGKRKFKMDRIRHLGIGHYFDDITLGDDVNLVKPNERVFRLSAKRLGVRPEECIYVGDRPPADFPCSKSIGFTTVYTFQNVERQEFAYIDYYIPKISGVLKIVDELNSEDIKFSAESHKQNI